MYRVSVVLNTWRRPHTLKEQYEAIQNQTIPPREILVWQNHPCDPRVDFDLSYMDEAQIATNNCNYGVWSRFAFALNTTSDYICVMDDDTIPGRRWFENCLDSINDHANGLYGTIGVVFNDLDYRSYTRYGWDNPITEVKQVDIVGHSWFFHRDLLGAFWQEAPVPISRICGEDMHFAYAIQKYLGLNTYVPPHPPDDLELWGSNKQKAYNYGVDENAVSVNYHGQHFGLSLKHYHQKGFKLLNV
jgi:GT2 family glycosyltransferase